MSFHQGNRATGSKSISANAYTTIYEFILPFTGVYLFISNIDLDSAVNSNLIHQLDFIDSSNPSDYLRHTVRFSGADGGGSTNVISNTNKDYDKIKLSVYSQSAVTVRYRYQFFKICETCNPAYD